MDYFSDLLSQEIRRIVREEVKVCLQEEEAKTNQKIAAALRMAADSIEAGAKDTPSSILLNDFKNYEEGIPPANSPKKSEKMEEGDKSSVPDLAEEKKEDGGNSARGDPEPVKDPSASLLNHLPRLSGGDRRIDEIPLSDSPPRHFREDRGMDEIEIEDLEEKEESFPMGTSDIDAGEKRGNSSEREADSEKISNEDVMKTLMEDMLAIVNEVPEKQDVALPDPYELKQKVVFDKIVPGDIIYCGLPKEDSVLSQMDPSHRARIYVVISKHYDKLLCFYCSTKEKGDPELRITMDPNRCSTYQKGYMYLGKTQLVPSSEIISAVGRLPRKEMVEATKKINLAIANGKLKKNAPRFSLHTDPDLGDVVDINGTIYVMCGYLEGKSRWFYKYSENPSKGADWVECRNGDQIFYVLPKSEVHSIKHSTILNHVDPDCLPRKQAEEAPSPSDLSKQTA